jgi:hypothetical protein
MKIRRMRISRWIPKATNTYSQYLMLLLFHCNSGCQNLPLTLYVQYIDCILLFSFLKCRVKAVKPRGLLRVSRL